MSSIEWWPMDSAPKNREILVTWVDGQHRYYDVATWDEELNDFATWNDAPGEGSYYNPLEAWAELTPP